MLLRLMFLLIVLGVPGWFVLRSQPAEVDEELKPEPFATRPIGDSGFDGSLPSWAHLAADARIHVATGLPTRLEDEHGIVYCLVPAGTLYVGSRGQDGYRDEDFDRDMEMQSFYMSRDEISIGLVRRVLAQPLREDGLETYPDELPAVFVSHDQAMVFADQIGARLPFEFEYEYAAKGPDSYRAWPWGSRFSAAGDALIDVDHAELELEYDDAEILARVLGRSADVKSDVSWCGVRNLAGSVAEWCLNGRVEAYFRASRLAAPRDIPGFSDSNVGVASAKAFRGGSWLSSAGSARCSNRSYARPEDRLRYLGFRVVRVL